MREALVTPCSPGVNPSGAKPAAALKTAPTAPMPRRPDDRRESKNGGSRLRFLVSFGFPFMVLVLPAASALVFPLRDQPVKSE